MKFLSTSLLALVLLFGSTGTTEAAKNRHRSLKGSKMTKTSSKEKAPKSGYRDVAWTYQPGRPDGQLEPIKGTKSAKLAFQWEGQFPHNVVEFADKAAFDACDFSNGEELCPPSLDDNGDCLIKVKETSYYGCSINAGGPFDHCVDGDMKVAVELDD